jgi:hypothetical protein
VSYYEAKAKYEGYREVVLALTLEDFRSSEAGCAKDPSLMLTGIDAATVANWKEHWGKVWFPWDALLRDYRSDVDRFEVAIWLGQKVMGMSYGRVSRGPENVTIQFLERFGDETPLKGWVALIVADCADKYAKLLGKQWVKVKDPVPGAIPVYETLGFTLAETLKGRTYYARQVMP